MSITVEVPGAITPPNTRVKEALDHVRAAAQELHGALTDTAAKRGGAVKADLEAIPGKAKAIAESISALIGEQSAAAKKLLGEAVTFLDAAGTEVAEALKSSGRGAETAVQRAIMDARASVQKISEAVAAKRSVAASPNPKK